MKTARTSVALAALIISLMPLRQARAGSTTVIGNTAANPVPTVAQGTTNVAGSVSISGTPNVSISGTPNVAVTNFPANQTVTVSNLPANQAVTVSNLPANQAVTVTNLPSTQAVSVNNFPATQQVVDVERMARVPYMSSITQACNPTGSACFFQFATPPQGTRLVAENISGYFFLNPTATTPVVGFIEEGGLPFTIYTAFTAPLASKEAGNNLLAAVSQPTRFYVDGGTPVVGWVNATFDGGPGSLVLTGYLENCSVTGCPAIAH